MDMRVREWMRHPVISVRPRDSAAHARAIMEQHRVNQLPVFEGPRLVGIVSDRDLRDAFPSLAESMRAPSRRRPKSTDPTAIPVEDVMTRDVLTVEPDTLLVDAARLLRQKRIGAVPVVAAATRSVSSRAATSWTPSSSSWLTTRAIDLHRDRPRTGSDERTPAHRGGATARGRGHPR